MGNQMKKTKKQKKNISHNPQVESVKACFGEPKANHMIRLTLKYK